MLKRTIIEWLIYFAIFHVTSCKFECLPDGRLLDYFLTRRSSKKLWLQQKALSRTEAGADHISGGASLSHHMMSTWPVYLFSFFKEIPHEKI